MSIKKSDQENLVKIIHHAQVASIDLPDDAIAATYVSFIEISDVNTHAQNLLAEISNTSWISKLNPVAKMSYEEVALKTIQKLVEIFQTVNNTVTKDFGEFMISMSSGHYMNEKHNHTVLPLSELWKEKLSNNHGFDFHTLSPADKFSFGEAKFVSKGNSYTSAAEQVVRLAGEGKDRIDAVHLMHFGKAVAIDNLGNGKRGFIVSFSINTNDYATILKNSLNNENIKKLTKSCDELYIIGVKA